MSSLSHPEIKTPASDAPLRFGLDIGSTTVKGVVTDADGDILFSRYFRHNADARRGVFSLLDTALAAFPGRSMRAALTGSGAIGVARELDLPFVQEVIAATRCIRRYLPEADVAVEIGGEDAKLTFFDPAGVDQRMNETCAGGTGAFIDQMAVLLRTDAAGLDRLARDHKNIYSIAARCGVFAKTDIMPLLNEGATREDIAASIFQAVVDQILGGLACGRRIRGRVAFLGGPLFFLPELRRRFARTLELGDGQTLSPENAQYYVAMGAALLAGEGSGAGREASPAIEVDELARRSREARGRRPPAAARLLTALFGHPDERAAFEARHARARAERRALSEVDPEREALYLGVDAGSTTTKLAVIDENKRLVHSWYGPNHGSPLDSAVSALMAFYAQTRAGGRAAPRIARAGVTGYGEALLAAALGFDFGEVETVAHYTAAAHFRKTVSFILDIGGQDIKCIHIREGRIDQIKLNEACSSGCGAFIETFAKSMELPLPEFVERALSAQRPVDLGSRCTVFMNSCVKQAQKEGADMGDIAAGLAYSVVRNALYKVMKIADADELGPQVVVQGGALANDAVLRALELTLARETVRPDIAGLMGAFGAALLARESDAERTGGGDFGRSNLLDADALSRFTVERSTKRCRGCGHRCLITVNDFGDGEAALAENIPAGSIGSLDPIGGVKPHDAEDAGDIETMKTASARCGDNDANAESARGGESLAVVSVPMKASPAAVALSSDGVGSTRTSAPAAAAAIATTTLEAATSSSNKSGTETGTSNSTPTSASTSTSASTESMASTATRSASADSAPARTSARRGGGRRRFASGQRCEKGEALAGLSPELRAKPAPNLFAYKYKRLFEHYVPHAPENAPRGEIGLPRVLNMFENYPFWFTLLHELGFRVVLSSPSSRALFNAGLETIASQTVCYPAKMVHGHIVDLLRRGVKTIFYPCLPYEAQEYADADNHFNCPVVASYPEVIRLNVDELAERGARFLQPFLPIGAPKRLLARLREELADFGPGRRELARAVRLAYAEQEAFRADLRSQGEALVRRAAETGQTALILAGRPYHLDPGIHHGIPDAVAALGVAVLTEDSVAHLGSALPFKLNVVDQWVYHSRLYRAANLAATHPHLELVQLNSFGCGLDAVTTEQVEAILATGRKPYTLIKIDEGSNLGVARIRIRSLLASLARREARLASGRRSLQAPTLYTRDMRLDRTLLIPQLAPLHFRLLQHALAPCGYNVEVLPNVKPAMVEEGLRYVNNDACYPALAVVGQLIEALKSGRHDPDKTVLMISQTNGGCRATNYVSFLRGAVARAGFGQVPVLPFNLRALQRNPEFKASFGMLRRMLMAIAYGDVLMRVSNRIRPYETVKGAVDQLVENWFGVLARHLDRGSHAQFARDVSAIVRDFDILPIFETPKPKIGVVGEILVKFHPDVNNRLVSVIEEEGGEAVVPDFLGFIQYCLFDEAHNREFLSGSRWTALTDRVASAYIEWLVLRPMRQAFAASKRFRPPHPIGRMARKVREIVSVCNQNGEGWLLTAEMMTLIEDGVPNIVCVQPFACLPNHITGKGVIKELKRRYEKANIVAVDYDPGASAVNQVNRIKLMMGSIRP